MYNKIGHKYKIIIFKLLHQLVGSLSPPIFSVVVSVFRRRIWAPVPAIRIACWEFWQNTSILFNTDPSHELENTPLHQFNLYFLSLLFLQLACVEQPGPLLPLFSQCLQSPLSFYNLYVLCSPVRDFLLGRLVPGCKRIRTICIFNLFTLADSNCEPFPIKCSGKRKYHYIQYLSNFTISSHHLWRGKYLQSPGWFPSRILECKHRIWRREIRAAAWNQ